MIRPATPDEFPALRALVLASFEAEVAELLGQAGRLEYSRYTRVSTMKQRMIAGNRFWLLEDAGKGVAMAETREDSHLVMLFVHPERFGQGYGRMLLEHALQLGVRTVSASPNAVGFYERAGFKPTDEEQTKNGLRFVPMAR